MSQAAILVVDDDPRVLEVIRGYLEGSSYQVDYYSDADKALDSARDKDYALFLLDVVMEGTDGYTVAGRLIEGDPKNPKPVLFISSHINMNELFLKNFAGKADFISKPFKKKELLDKIEGLTQSASTEKRPT